MLTVTKPSIRYIMKCCWKDLLSLTSPKRHTSLRKVYLSSKSQIVKICQSHSQAFGAISGVPQGSNLGPLLFLMFIKTLPSCIEHYECLLFAGYLSIFKPLSAKDLDSLNTWFHSNKMLANTQKCFTMT